MTFWIINWISWWLPFSPANPNLQNIHEGTPDYQYGQQKPDWRRRPWTGRLILRSRDAQPCVSACTNKWMLHWYQRRSVGHIKLEFGFCKISINYCKLSISDCKPLINYCTPSINDCERPTNECKRSINHIKRSISEIKTGFSKCKIVFNCRKHILNDCKNIFRQCKISFS